MSDKLRISLVGNPNTGKSSLFNALTGLKQKVGNFPGITVDKSTGYFSLGNGRTAEITDLPGTYSLFPKSPDEAVPYQLLLDNAHPQHPELVLFIADASNLKRNLVLLTQIIDLRLPVILALNMVDQAEAKGISIDVPKLSEKLGIPIVSINARRRQGISKVIEQINAGGAVPEKHFFASGRFNLLTFDELNRQLRSATKYQTVLQLHHSVAYPPREPARKQLLEDFRRESAFDSGVFQREDLLHRYREVSAILDGCVTEKETTRFKRVQAGIDSVLTHKVWGYLIFFAILFGVFQSIFHLATWPMEWIEAGLAVISDGIASLMPEGILQDLLTNGILSGLSGVLVFIPQIAFLFFFIALMEDSGYLARVAFLMDRTMRRFGLNGKSVIPLISGTACAVPAIMAARNIESPKSRLITILVTPLMSCSARLPVYILLIGIVVPDRSFLGFLSWQGLALMGLYLLGFVSALGAAAFFQMVMKTKVKQYFILEMPAYHWPNMHTVGISVYKKVKTFIFEAGKIIIAISIILWFLASFGPSGSFQAVEDKYAGHPDREFAEQRIRTEQLQVSYAGQLGHVIEPVIRPLGFDWKIGIALISSFAAREVFVGTMATLYGLEGEEPDFSKIKENMLKARNPDTGARVYTTATVLSLLIFYVFALQCMSTVAVTYKETASLKWTLIQLGFMTGLAYFASLLVYQLLV